VTVVDAEPRVSATVISDQLRLMRELHGGEMIARAIEAMPPNLREEIEHLLPGSWVSTDAARELKVAVATLLEEDVLDFQRRIVRQGIERTLNTVWRFFMRQLGDEALARRTPILYSRSFNRGSLELVRWDNDKGEYEFELEGWPRIPEFDLVGLMAGIECVMTLAGRKEPQITATRRGQLVLIRGVWKKK
jgi:hypothetical protein